MVNVPTFIVPQRLGDGGAVVTAVHGHVVLVAILANELKQILKALDLQYAKAAKAFGAVVCCFALAHVGAHSAVEIVGGSAAISDGSALQVAHNCAKRIVLAH